MTATSARFLALLILATASTAAGADQPVDFVRDIKPIFEVRCYDCHGAPSRRAASGSTPRSLSKAETPALPFHPRRPGQSHLLKLVRSDDPDEVMPPKGDRLSAPQIDLLTRWIQQGGNWPQTVVTAKPKLKHWSFNAPVRPRCRRRRSGLRAIRSISSSSLAWKKKGSSRHPRRTSTR